MGPMRPACLTPRPSSRKLSFVRSRATRCLGPVTSLRPAIGVGTIRTTWRHPSRSPTGGCRRARLARRLAHPVGGGPVSSHLSTAWRFLMRSAMSLLTVQELPRSGETLRCSCSTAAMALRNQEKRCSSMSRRAFVQCWGSPAATPLNRSTNTVTARPSLDGATQGNSTRFVQQLT